MTTLNYRTKQAKTIRVCRKIHRKMAIFLFILFLFISISGLLLGWKKHSNGIILPVSKEGSSINLKDWLTIDSLNNIATYILHHDVSPDLSTELDRIDIRKNSGMVKFIYKNHYWGIQLDGATGALLSLEKRRSDFIENVHDGSILDKYLKTNNAYIKLIYTSVMGLSLLVFSLTGFWLWYGPKRMQRKKKS